MGLGMVHFAQILEWNWTMVECWSWLILLKPLQAVPTLFFCFMGTSPLQYIFFLTETAFILALVVKNEWKMTFSASFTKTITSTALYLFGMACHDGSHAWDLHLRCCSPGDSCSFLQWMTAHQKKIVSQLADLRLNKTFDPLVWRPVLIVRTKLFQIANRLHCSVVVMS